MTVAKAGSILGMDRMSAIRWYTSLGFDYPNLDDADLLGEWQHAKLG
ncbi:MAG TPA: hypothetical protein VF171_00070 [Trueperaceae bacterium]